MIIKAFHIVFGAVRSVCICTVCVPNLYWFKEPGFIPTTNATIGSTNKQDDGSGKTQTLHLHLSLRRYRVSLKKQVADKAQKSWLVARHLSEDLGGKREMSSHGDKVHQVRISHRPCHLTAIFPLKTTGLFHDHIDLLSS